MGRFSKKADKYFVYEIVNIMGTIEYVGETYDIEQRFLNHISKSGKFYKRQDIIINIVAEFPTKKEAYAYQCKLQNEYGWSSDLDKTASGARDAKRKSILCFDAATNTLIKEYDAMCDAAKELNVYNAQIHRVLKGKHVEALKNYIFKYK